MNGQPHGATQKILVLLIAGLAFASNFSLSDWVRIEALTALGNPPYAGPWALFSHAFLYSTLTAFICLAAWLMLRAMKLMPAIPLATGKRPVFWGAIGAAVTIAATLGFFAATAPDAIHWIPPKPWIIAGNLFSNFYEEFIYRGFFLAAFSAVFGFWPAAILSSLAFGLTHEQYPLPVQLLAAAIGVVFCLVLRAARTIWAPWIAHMGLDVVVDSLVG